MPTTIPHPARPCRFLLETNPEPDVLVRVLTLLRRRGCRIVALDFHEPDQHGPGRFEVSVRAPTRTGHRLESWLAGLVDVIAVREAGAVTTSPTRHDDGADQTAVIEPAT